MYGKLITSLFFQRNNWLVFPQVGGSGGSSSEKGFGRNYIPEMMAASSSGNYLYYWCSSPQLRNMYDNYYQYVFDQQKCVAEKGYYWRPIPYTAKSNEMTFVYEEINGESVKIAVLSNVTIGFEKVMVASGQGGGLLSPVDTKYPITSPYTEGNRVIPELGINRPHLAIDIGTPVGTLIRSPWSGKVVMAQDTKYGLSVIVKHDYKYNGQYIQTGYAHLSEMSVTNGLTINRGDAIGYTGTWGTGPHLHFTLRIGDQKVNPILLFPYK